MTTTPRRPTPASRATRRSRRPAPRSQSFIERNRTRLLWGVGALVFLLLAGMAYSQFTRPTYACTTIWDPSIPPAAAVESVAPAASGASPGPAQTAQPPGIAQPDMGHLHEPNVGATVTYRYCPPASGKHYNATGQGPIDPRVYGPDDRAVPPGWVHNLEHGALVVLYKCPGPGCDDQGQAALQALYDKLPPTPICKLPANRLAVFARFDDMVWPYAALVWDVVLPLQTLDEAAILDFYNQRAEQFNPERCIPPSPSPAPASPTPVASQPGSPAASGTVAPATTAPSP